MSKKLVRLIYPFNWVNTFRLIPGFKTGTSVDFGDVVFTTDVVEEADLAVIVNFSPYKLNMRAKEAWIFHHEPANYKLFSHWTNSYKYVDRVFGSWIQPKNKKWNIIQTQSSIFWQCPREYEYYKNSKCEKARNLSAITSSKTLFSGHKERLEFLYTLRDKFKGTEFEFVINGRGVLEVDTKDEILMPSKYTIAIENTFEDHYFSEKITDAYLCNCMPIYYGAPNIFEYFPEGSLIKLEDLDVEKAALVIQNAIKEDYWGKNFDKLMIAKDLVLNKYSFFTSIIEKMEEYNIASKQMKNIYVPKSRQKKHPILSEIKTMVNKIRNN